jgi:5-methylcytosine-specific restriction endonuclease McrA
MSAEYRKSHRKHKNAWYQRNRAEILERNRDYRYRRDFGITIQQYDKMLAMGDGCCWICGRPPKTKRLAVEHSHKKPDKGRVRGLACHNCNQYLIGKNTAESAKKVLVYLESSFDGRALVV